MSYNLIFTDDANNPEVVLKSTRAGKFNDLPQTNLINPGTPSNTLSLQAKRGNVGACNAETIKVYKLNTGLVRTFVNATANLKLFSVTDPQFLNGMNGRYNCNGPNPDGNILVALAPKKPLPVAVATPVTRPSKKRVNIGRFPLTKYINGRKHLWTGRDGWKEIIPRGSPRYSTADRNIYYKKYLKYKQKYLALKKTLAEDN